MKAISFFILAASATSAFSAPLSDYTNFNAYRIDEWEASAVTYNRDTNTLFIVGDAGSFVTEYSLNGSRLSRTAIGGFNDVEAIAYIGLDSQGRSLFMVGDERVQEAAIITYTRETSPRVETHKNSLPIYKFGPDVGNEGLEGLAYDPLTNAVWGVKEKNPQALYHMTLDTNILTVNPFDPSVFGTGDLSDIYVMAASAAFVGTDRELNLLILSQESQILFEVTRDGTIIDSLYLAELGLPNSTNIEGVAMDDMGTLYLVAEGGGNNVPSHLYVLTAVPEPSTYALIVGGLLGGFAILRKRRQKAAA